MKLSQPFQCCKDYVSIKEYSTHIVPLSVSHTVCCTSCWCEILTSEWAEGRNCPDWARRLLSRRHGNHD